MLVNLKTMIYNTWTQTDGHRSETHSVLFTYVRNSKKESPLKINFWLLTC